MNKEQIEDKRNEVQELVDYFQKEIRRIAQEVRNEVIVPYCELNNLDFHTLMDGYYFQNADNMAIEEENIPEDIKELCYIEVDGLILPSYMENYYTNAKYLGKAEAHGKV